MKHVLIIDDSEKIRARLAALLTESNRVRVVGQAGSGRDALEILNRLKPDTIILDIRLPDRSGIELLKEIKARHPGTTVIMMTNYDDDRYRRQCRRLGADEFLNKSMEFDHIVDTVNGIKNN